GGCRNREDRGGGDNGKGFLTRNRRAEPMDMGYVLREDIDAWRGLGRPPKSRLAGKSRTHGFSLRSGDAALAYRNGLLTPCFAIGSPGEWQSGLPGYRHPVRTPARDGFTWGRYPGLSVESLQDR